MKAAFVKAPFRFEIRDVELRTLGDEEILVDIRACGLCGTDLEAAALTAADWQPLGHEVAGVVAAVGRRCAGLRTGQKVVLASRTFDRYSRLARDGRVELDDTGPACRSKEPMGFSERMIAPRELAVPFDGISFTAASLAEPLAVALDLVRVAEIGVGDDVLVIGAGAVGLMALRLARSRGARRLTAAQRSGARKRLELALEMGADDIVLDDQERLREHRFDRGGVDRVLVTAPPGVLPDALAVTNPGGIVAFVGGGSGSGPGSGGVVSLDADEFRARRLQLRASRPSPTLRLPTCLELIQSGIVDAERLVSHTFQLEEIPQAFRIMRDDRQNRVKLVMVKD